MSVALDMVGGDAKSFFSDFYERPYLILLDQWTSTEYYPQSSAHGDQKFIGNDRRWSVSFVKPSSKTAQHYDLTYFDPVHSPGLPEPHPICIAIPGSSMDVLTYHYDFINKRFKAGIFYKSLSQQLFSYVIGSANLSNAVNFYPYYNTLSGNVFSVGSSVPGGISRHYDWWIGQKNIENNVKPIDPIEPPVEPPPEPPKPPELPPDDNVQPDVPLKPFDPTKPPDSGSGGDGGYLPPPGGGDDPWLEYDPGKDVVIPPMPEFPTKPPDLPAVEDPFKPPTDLPTVDDPFKPPTDLPAVDDPFKPPTDLPTVDDPFKPPTDLPTVDDPFKPPTDLPTVEDPFKPPTDFPTVDDPFKPPTDLPIVDDPFKPQAAARGASFFGYNPFVIPDFLKRLFNLGN